MLTSSVTADVRACCLSGSMVGRAVLTAPRRSEDARNVPAWATSCSALGTARPTPIRSDSLANTPVNRRLAFGHSGFVNPQGCQRVAGGRRGLRGRRPPGNRAGDVLHPGRGARSVSEPDRTGQGSTLASLRCARFPTPSSGDRSPVPVNVASLTIWRRFPLSPSEGERAWVRGPSWGSGVQSASKCRGVLNLNDYRVPSGNPATNEARRQS